MVSECDSWDVVMTNLSPASRLDVAFYVRVRPITVWRDTDHPPDLSLFPVSMPSLALPRFMRYEYGDDEVYGRLIYAR